VTAVQIVAVVLLIVGGYLLGSVPFGLLISKCFGVDVRLAGSGNIGATNVWRVLGWRCGLSAFLLDTLKGLAPMALAPGILGRAGAWSGVTAGGHQTAYLAWLAIGAAVILGHVFPVYLRFRGGKGVSTSLGVLLGVWPYYAVPALICFALWVILFALSRYVSLSSVIAAVAFPLVYVLIAVSRGWEPWGNQRPLLIFAVVIAVLVVYRHRTNLQRLLAGQENRFGRQRPNGADGTAA
jgi:acyl phosphate:glycerol-3-phosphate acyltransferase